MSATPRLRVLHVEDERNARLMVQDLLAGAAELVSVGSAEEGIAALRQRAFDVTLLDWMLPGADGGQFLEATRAGGRAGRVVVLTAVGTVERAVGALRAGAYDFLVKPVDPDALLEVIERAGRSAGLIDAASRSSPEVAPEPTQVAAAGILGETPAIEEVRARLLRVAASDAPVLIVGETGTGKELVARALHEASGRHRSRLVVVNCAALPESLFEAELFGHKKGAYTGAAADRAGLCELADGGTLFLDEVGELLPAAQAKLLRALQERSIRRVGENHDRKVDARVIAATNRDLEQEVDRGAFRADLLHRLDVVRIEVPPLRARLADLPPLLDHFVERCAVAWGRPAPSFTPPQLDWLQTLEWPGNVRELENFARRAVLLGAAAAMSELRARRPAPAPRGSDVRPIAEAPPPGGPVPTLDEAVKEATRAAILRALAVTDGSRTRAAELLGVSRKTLFNKIRELGIKEETSWG